MPIPVRCAQLTSRAFFMMEDSERKVKDFHHHQFACDCSPSFSYPQKAVICDELNNSILILFHCFAVHRDVLSIRDFILLS